MVLVCGYRASVMVIPPAKPELARMKREVFMNQHSLHLFFLFFDLSASSSSK